MKEIKKITTALPNGKKIELRLYSLNEGINIFAVYETPSKIETRHFNKTKKCRTLEDNINRACRYFKMAVLS